MLDNLKPIVNRLDRLDKIMNKYPRDSNQFIQADNASEELRFSKVPPQDYGLIMKRLGRKLTNHDFAKAIVAANNHEAITKAFDFPASLAMAYQLRQCQESTGLNQLEFAKRYRIPQPKLSKMESGVQQVDVDDFQRILHSLNRKFMIA